MALICELTAGLLGRPWRAAPTNSTPPSAAATGRTARLVSLGGAGTAPLLSRVAANFGTAVEAVQDFWGVDWPGDITVEATGSQRQFEAAAGGDAAARWADIAAITVADRVDPARRVAGGQRIVFAPGAAAMTEPALRIVLTHELFHYAARADTAADAPRWLTEGVADFVARPHMRLPPGTPLPAALPSDGDLGVPGARRSLAYDRAWWFARFVADTYGSATLRALYRAACGVGHTDVPTAVRDTLGVDTAVLLDRWQRWLAG